MSKPPAFIDRDGRLWTLHKKSGRYVTEVTNYANGKTFPVDSSLRNLRREFGPLRVAAVTP